MADTYGPTSGIQNVGPHRRRSYPPQQGVQTPSSRASAPSGTDDTRPDAKGLSRASTVPDGTVADVLEWVGQDRERAERALAVEEAQDSPRTTLTEPLERLLTDPDSSD